MRLLVHDTSEEYGHYLFEVTEVFDLDEKTLVVNDEYRIVIPEFNSMTARDAIKQLFDEGKLTLTHVNVFEDWGEDYD